MSNTYVTSSSGTIAFDRNDPKYKCCCCCCCSIHSKKGSWILGVLELLCVAFYLLIAFIVLLVAGLTGKEFYSTLGGCLFLAIPIIAVVCLLVGLCKENHWLVLVHIVWQVFSIVLLVSSLISCIYLIATEAHTYNRSPFRDFEENSVSKLNEDDREIFDKRQEQRRKAMLTIVLASLGLVSVLIGLAIEIWLLICTIRCYRCFRDRKQAETVGMSMSVAEKGGGGGGGAGNISGGGGNGGGKGGVGGGPIQPSAPQQPHEVQQHYYKPLYPEMPQIT